MDHHLQKLRTKRPCKLNPKPEWNITAKHLQRKGGVVEFILWVCDLESVVQNWNLFAGSPSWIYADRLLRNPFMYTDAHRFIKQVQCDACWSHKKVGERWKLTHCRPGTHTISTTADGLWLASPAEGSKLSDIISISTQE